MASTTQVRRALAARLHDLQCRVTPAGTDFATDRGFHTTKFQVRVLAGPDDEETAEALDLLLDSDGDRSIKQRLEADPTLDGLVNNVQVVKATGYQLFPPVVPDGPQVLGATFTVQTL